MKIWSKVADDIYKINFMKITMINWMCLAFFPLTSLATTCHPQIDVSKRQFLIGYGSLMDEQSKQNTLKVVRKNMPIILLYHKRGWFARGKMANQNCTFLGVKEDAYGFVNAVVFEVGHEVQAFDLREKDYCRKLVKPQHIMPLVPMPNYNNAEIWVYQPSEKILKKPSPQYPINQEYLNIFLKGCFQIQKQFGFAWFYKTCLQTTSDWQYVNQ